MRDAATSPNVTWKKGELEKLPIDDRSVDIALLSQALHHAEDPAAALSEAKRILVPGGRVVILDLREHDQDWVRDRLGDRWLGFSETELRKLLASAGFEQIKVIRRCTTHRRSVYGVDC